MDRFAFQGVELWMEKLVPELQPVIGRLELPKFAVIRGIGVNRVNVRCLGYAYVKITCRIKVSGPETIDIHVLFIGKGFDLGFC